jgi:hypothetical protein
MCNSWVSYCCLTPMSTFSAMSWQEQVTFWRDYKDVQFVLYQHAQSDFDSASLLKQQSTGRHIAPLHKHYPDSEPTSLCSFSLVLSA